MSLSVIGVNHRQPVEFREKLAFATEDIPAALEQLTRTGDISGAIILSTCNRVEIYFYSEVPHAAKHVLDLLSVHAGLEQDVVAQHVYHYTHEEAIRHLLRVCCGLDSVVLGEPQILEQAKLAYQLARDHGAVGSLLGHIFERTFAIAKRLRTETEISTGSVSTGRAAVELVREQLGDLRDKRVLIIGAGKIAMLAARYFHSYGVRHMTILNRTHERAQAVASLFHADALPLSELRTALRDADVIVSCTSAESLIITRELLADAIENEGHPRVLVDLAVPRDIDPGVADLPGVRLFDVDRLDKVTDANWEQRRQAAEEIERQIDLEVEKCLYHIHSRQIGPAIQSLRQRAEQVRQETLKRHEKRLKTLSEEERATVEYLTRAVVNTLLHTPISQLKQKAGSPEYLEAVQHLFQLEGEGHV